MNIKHIKINTNYHYEDGTNLDFNFFGTTENINIDQEQLEKNIDNIFLDRKIFPTMMEAVTILKTILKNIQETHLFVNLYKDEVFSQSVIYRFSKLGIYSYHQEITPKHNLDIHIDYSVRQGLRINVNDKKDNILDNTNMEILGSQIYLIHQLQNIQGINLLEEDKLLIDVYRLFFQENPNFTKEEDRVKTYSMLALLEEFGVELYDDNNEELLFDFDYGKIFSPKLSQKLYKLSSFGEITEPINENLLSTRVKTIIKIVSKKIRENMKIQPNPIEWFQNIVKINYMKNNYLPSDNDELEFAEYTNSSKDTVKQNVKKYVKLTTKLVKKSKYNQLNYKFVNKKYNCIPFSFLLYYN